MNKPFVRMWAIAAVAVAGLVLLWFSRRVLLLLFSALLLALVLTSLTRLLRKALPVGHKPAYILVLLLLAVVLSAAGMLVAPTVTEQFGELADRIPKVVADLRQRAEKVPAIQRTVRLFGDPADILTSDGAGEMATSAVSSTFQMASSLFFVAFSAIFLAATPKLYREMVIKCVPPRRRDAARHTINRVVCTLKSWLAGQAVSMSAVGAATGVALWIAGIPFAPALGILAGLAEFIPLVGPVLASVPALLLALTEGIDKVLIVLAIILGIQFLEGNVLMPIVQRKAVDLPPVLTLLALLLLGEAFGLVGLFVAAPLAAMALVLAEEIYIRRVLRTNDKLLD